jgi:hypothetical protein
MDANQRGLVLDQLKFSQADVLVTADDEVIVQRQAERGRHFLDVLR